MSDLPLPLPLPLPPPSQVLSDVGEAGSLLSVCAFLQRVLPRGKGAVPRRLGRLLAPPNRRYLVTRHGVRLVLASGGYDVYATMLLNGRAWDYHDFEVCVGALTEGGVFYDVGANVGYMALEMAACKGARTQVVAFEPQADLSSAIRLSAALNGFTNVQVFDCLVGDRSGPAEFFVAPASINSSAVADSGRAHRKRVHKAMATIDDLVRAGAIAAPDMVKIDVEGSEHLVLKGAAATLRSARPHVFLEYMDECDPGRRVRHEIEALAQTEPDYRVYGQPRQHLQARAQHRFLRLDAGGDWRHVHAVFLRNMQRPLANAADFEP